MTTISGVVWVAVGIIVGAFSVFVEKTADQPMLFFEIIAGAFVCVGVVKIIWAIPRRKKKAKENPFSYDARMRQEQMIMQQQANMMRQQQFMAQQPRRTQQQERPQQYPENPSMITPERIIQCPMCGAKHYAHSNFCHICGSRLKKY